MTGPRIDRSIGEYERSGVCESCGEKVTRTKTIVASSYERMVELGEEWGETPLMHAKCERKDRL